MSVGEEAVSLCSESRGVPMGLGVQASAGDLPVQGAQGGGLGRALTAQHEGT